MTAQDQSPDVGTVVPDPRGQFFQVCAEGRIVRGDFESEQAAEDWRQVRIESARVWR